MPLLKEALADGYEIVQEGRVLIKFDPNAKPKPSFSDRVEGFDFGKYRYPGDKLLDDDERWVHLRKPDA